MTASQAQRSPNVSTPFPVLICSIPKAGTYLLSSIVEILGFAKTHFHISKDEYSDYRFGSREEHRKNPEKFRVVASYQSVLSSLPPGTHAVSHLPCDEGVQTVCRQSAIKVFFLARDLRDCAISYMRFLADTGRDDSAQAEWMQAEDGPQRLIRFLETYHWFFAAAQSIISWQSCPIANTIRFESLLGDYGVAAQHHAIEQICAHVCLEAARVNMQALLSSTLHTPTLTWSGQRTQRSLYWSDTAEQRFIELGGDALNRHLGYE
jgi:hypothetical protein